MAGSSLLLFATPLFISAEPIHSTVLPLLSAHFVQGELLVKFKPGTPAQAIQDLHALNRTAEIDGVEPLGISRVQLPAGSSVEAMMDAYRRNPNVLFAEPNYIGYAQDSPNDPEFVAGNQWGLNAVSAPRAWDVSQGSPSVVVAVIDSGVSNVPDLAGRLVPGFNYVDGTTDTTDTYDHGTPIAGIIAADTNNSTGVAGMARFSSIMPLKIINDTGSFSGYNLCQALAFAADNGAKVINMSFGMLLSSSSVQTSINYAFSKGAVLVASAGNYNTTPLLFPASIDNPHDVISVGATDLSDNRWTGTNYGPLLDVMAPGVAIRSTVNSGSYGDFGGTSFSAPFVSGLAALMFGANPALTNQQVMDIIRQTAAKVGTNPAPSDPSYVTYFGNGRIDACAALKAAVPASPVTCGSTTTAAPTPTPTAVSVAPTPTPTAAPVAPTSTPTSTSTPVAPTPTPTPPPATATPAPSSVTQTFSGSVTATGSSSQSFTITLNAPGTISATLNWSGNSNLNLYLWQGTAQLASSATRNRPEVITYNAAVAGTYTLQVAAVKGSASYTLSVTHP